MQLTLEEVMELDIMDSARVLSAKNTLTHRPVESVSVIEVPVENFVRQNELVLTTGVGCGSDTELLLGFVSDVLNCRASGLAIATGRHVMKIPPEVIHLGNKHDFPIIEIPWETRFSDITRQILNSLNHHQQNLLKESSEIQDQLLNLILSSSDLSEIANFVYHRIHSPVIIVNRQGHVIGQSLGAEVLAGEWSKNTQFGFKALASTPEHRESRTTTSPYQRMHKVGTHRFVKVPIRSASELLGHLVTSVSADIEDASPLSLESAYVMEHASTAAAFAFLRTNLIQSTQTRLRNNFVWNLANGEMESWDAIVTQAEFYGYQIRPQNVCLLANFENLHQIFNKSVRDVSFDHWSENTLERLEACIQEVQGAGQHALMTTHHQHQLMIFYGTSMDDDPDTSLSFLIDALQARMNDVVEGLIISWGIGNYQAGSQAFHQSYQQAQRALELGLRKKGRGHRTYFSEVSLNEAFVKFANDEEIQKVTYAVLGRLLQYDKHKGMDLVNTLTTYLRHQGNVSQTSRALNIHRQTLIYRLHKIESLTDRSLSDPEDLFLLDLSLRISAVSPEPDPASSGNAFPKAGGRGGLDARKSGTSIKPATTIHPASSKPRAQTKE